MMTGKRFSHTVTVTKRHTDFIQTDEDVEVRGSVVSVCHTKCQITEDPEKGGGGSGCDGSGVKRQQVCSGCRKRMRGDSGLLPQREEWSVLHLWKSERRMGSTRGSICKTSGGKLKKTVCITYFSL